jgi:hypothetical protein
MPVFPRSWGHAAHSAGHPDKRLATEPGATTASRFRRALARTFLGRQDITPGSVNPGGFLQLIGRNLMDVLVREFLEMTVPMLLAGSPGP